MTVGGSWVSIETLFQVSDDTTPSRPVVEVLDSEEEICAVDTV
jgi:hypothetical protein